MSVINYTPFPFNVTPASPMFELSPITSSTSRGWVPSCTTPECVPTATWSTSSIGASLSLHYWGWGLTFKGSVEGNMSVEVIRDEVSVPWNPAGDTLFSVPGGPNDEIFLHNVTLKVLDASLGAELSIIQAQINGSASLTEIYYPGVRWIIPSNDPRLNYTGFVQQPSLVQSGSQTTYMSSNTGDAVSMQFNASTLLLHGPCGPTTGVMKVTIDGIDSIINTTKPITSNDCILFQALGLKYDAGRLEHELLIENAGGGSLGIDRIEFFWLDIQFEQGFERAHGVQYKTLGITLGVVMVVLWILICGWVLKNNFKRKGHSRYSNSSSY